VLQLQKFDLEQPREGDQALGSSMARGWTIPWGGHLQRHRWGWGRGEGVARHRATPFILPVRSLSSPSPSPSLLLSSSLLLLSFSPSLLCWLNMNGMRESREGATGGCSVWVWQVGLSGVCVTPHHSAWDRCGPIWQTVRQRCQWSDKLADYATVLMDTLSWWRTLRQCMAWPKLF
jgi:hypothetical protein